MISLELQYNISKRANRFYFEKKLKHMNEALNQIKVEIVEYKPEKVKVKFVSNESEVELGKRFFEKRVDMGIYQVTNPEILPRVI